MTKTNELSLACLASLSGWLLPLGLVACSAPVTARGDDPALSTAAGGTASAAAGGGGTSLGTGGTSSVAGAGSGGMPSSGGTSGSGGTSASGGVAGSAGAANGGAGGGGMGGGSGGTSTCTDVAPDETYTCEQQASWGKCNETWMQDFCDTSCGRCTPDSGGGEGGASSDCGVLPVNPNASSAARNLLCYLYETAGKQVLSGQQETSWNADPDVDMKYIDQHTGKYPAIRGLDYLYGGTSDRAIAWWNAGGIPMICYHMGAPTADDTYQGSQASGASIDQALTAGSQQNKVFMQRLDKAAAELQKLEDQGVAVLWRPFHEAGGTWFWWSKEGGAQYVRLWKFMFDYYTNTKKLDNLLWLHPYNGEPQASFYPGKAYVDVAGADTYSSSQPFTTMYQNVENIVGSTLPIALHENGLMPDPDDMFANGGQAPWLLFNTWADTYLTQTNSVEYLQHVYGSSFVITRDEVPNLN